MEKKITLNGKEYTLEFKWATENYCFRIVGYTGYNSIPMDCLKDIEKLKPYILKAMENNHDFSVIESWDGNMDSSDNPITKQQEKEEESAVEWLEGQIRWSISNDDRLYSMFEKAKEMEFEHKLKFVKALRKIQLFSDFGNYEDAISEMKKIAKDTLQEAGYC
jgi:c-di-AMP phosphodiesterase-like protein